MTKPNQFLRIAMGKTTCHKSAPSSTGMRERGIALQVPEDRGKQDVELEETSKK